MWTNYLCNHPSEHHSALPSQPHVVVRAVGGLRGSDRQHPATAALDVDRQRSEAPILNRAGGRHSAGPTRQRLTLDAALVRSHPPCRRSEEHTSELQSRPQLVCRLLLEKKKKNVFLLLLVKKKKNKKKN